MKENADLAAAEEWVRQTWSLGGPYSRSQMNDHWNGQEGKRHRDTLQRHRPILLQATVNAVKRMRDGDDIE